jgi:hypothetical protein
MRTKRIAPVLAVALIAVTATFVLITTLAAAQSAADVAAPPGAETVADELELQERALARQWAKWVNGVAWKPDMVVTVETSDTIKVTDVVTTLPTAELQLVESWDPAHLLLLDYQAQPEGSLVVLDDGTLVWTVPEGRTQPFTLTKWFHVEPCTWARTNLTETLSSQGQPLGERAVAISKAPPDLWIDSFFDIAVYAGDVATFTLSYGNKGGYENGVWIRNTFPPEAPFVWSDPPPDVIAPDRLSAEWKVGDLARDDIDEIIVGVAITETAPPSTTIEIWDGIYDHVDEQRSFIVTTFHVEPPPGAVWGKWVNGLEWHPDLVVTAETSTTIEVVDLVESPQPFNLTESWDPSRLALLDSNVTSGELFTGAGRLEWQVGDITPGAMTLTKRFHVEAGPWGWTTLEEFLTVSGTMEPLVRVVPVEHPFPPIDFPGGDWPWYAQGEITVHPEPPIAGQPTRICAEVVNFDPAHAHTATIEFAVANFGIGVPFNPVGRAEVVVPPGHTEQGCIVWIPPTPQHWCIEARLIEKDVPYKISQRNVDVDEPLRPNTAHSLTFPVGNPLPEPVSITLGLIPHQADWGLELSQDLLSNMQPGEVREVTLTTTPPAELPPDGSPVVDVEAYAGAELIGGFRKVFRPPVILHRFPDPPYAEREITVEPYPVMTGRPSEVCVELHNPTDFPQEVTVKFAWANFGIGVPFTPIDGPRVVTLPPHSLVKVCTNWIPPVGGHVCLQAELFMEGYAPQRSQRNIDINEPLRPRVPDAISFPVGNPLAEPVSITLGLIPHQPGWGLELSQELLPDMQPGEVREVTLTTTPPAQLPPDGSLVVDIEARAGDVLVGGFRKIFRPPVILHRFPDPPYAEREITVEPYPTEVGRPTEVCVELRNPTPFPQDVVVQFSWANFGIGLPFTPIDGPRVVHLPPYSAVKECIHWIPPVSGHVCLQVEMLMEGYEPQRSQRNIDVNEPLEPLTPHTFTFPVGNPLAEPVSVSLGLIPHFPDWGLELSRDVLPNMQPGEVREVTLTVTPPADLPEDGAVIVDVEAYARDRLIGGFRKIFRPPVPIHRPRDPVYAESEISVDPYPAVPGAPTRLGVEVFNPTDEDHVVTATFSVANFGIGLPFSGANITPNPIRIFVPEHGAASGHVIWAPPFWQGKFCVRVTLQMEGHEPIWSQRNIDVGEPLRPGEPHTLVFPVGNPLAEPVSITLGLIPHKPGWQLALNPDTLLNMQPGQRVPVSLTVVPPADAPLGTGEPIVDVEAFVEGQLIGGFRKLDVPPVPIHKPHEPTYAESEILIDPYPPRKGKPTQVAAVLHNSSPDTVTVDLQFGWADFGIGIPFTTTGMVPVSRTVALNPEMTTTVGVTWTPVRSGHQCVQIRLQDAQQIYEPQLSQRNVDVVERPPCGETKVFTFTVRNDSPFSATVDIGLVTFNVPADWEITVVPSDTLVLDPFSEGVVTVSVRIPCPPTLAAQQARQALSALQQRAGSVPTIDVEGYTEGGLVGGIELQFSPAEGPRLLYLPVVLKGG